MPALSARRFDAIALCAALWLAIPLSLASAQQPMQHDHSQHESAPPQTQPAPAMDHSQHQHPATEPKAKKKPEAKKPKDPHAGHTMAPTAMPGMQHAAPKTGAPAMQHEDHASGMKGFFGPYSATREGSGTSWLPDATPHEGIHASFGEWNTMWHGLINGVYDHQGGARGGNKAFVSGMLMGMAQRPAGDGTFGVRAMLSPEPFMGPSGYPLLLATGETADGRSHLIDRQHPHELFMELAATYSYNISKTSSVFLYAGLPGEPALGPPAFMHRTSGMDIPEAPITHHWLDSTHITFGVVTAGVVLDTWKLEASAFRGREPDQYRYDIEAPKLDSFSGRVSWNPVRELSMQASWGRIHSPEQLEPDRNEDRFTLSAIYTTPFGNDNLWSTTAAWGRKINKPGNTLDGLILESAVILKQTYTLFARAERVQEDELTGHGDIYTVNKLSVGGIYDFWRTKYAKFGIGGLVSFYGLPSELRSSYGDPTSYMGFVRLKIL
jgi:hypothetical protein